MNIPGANLLQTALSLIGNQCFYLYRFASRSINAVGQDVSVYNPPEQHYGSIQPVPRRLYQENGLDFQKHYITVFVPTGIADIRRGSSGDIVLWEGQQYQALSETPWIKQDGWDSTLCVEVPNETLVENVKTPTPNAYAAAGVLQFVLDMSFPVTITGTPQIDLLIGTATKAATYVSGQQSLIFRYTVQSGDNGAVTLPQNAIDLNNGAITGPDNVPANVNFIAPNMAGISANA